MRLRLSAARGPWRHRNPTLIWHENDVIGIMFVWSLRWFRIGLSIRFGNPL